MIFLYGLFTGVVIGFLLGVLRTLKSLKRRVLKNAKKFLNEI